MKRFLSVICMALLAGGMILTSCTKTWTVTVQANDPAYGTVTGGGTYADGAEATLTATPKEGYVFVKWDNGETANPLKVTVTANVTYTAVFEPKENPGPGPGPEPQPQPTNKGVSVTFNGNSWAANDEDGGAFAGSFFPTQYGNAWDVAAVPQDAQSEVSPNTKTVYIPMADVSMITGTNTGSFTGTAGEDGGLSSDFSYLEYYNQGYLYDDTYNYGDWWAKSATVNITAFDATSLVMSANVTATMFDSYNALVEGAGVNGAPTASLTETITNVTLTDYTSKGIRTIKKNTGKKLFAKK